MFFFGKVSFFDFFDGFEDKGRDEDSSQRKTEEENKYFDDVKGNHTLYFIFLKCELVR